MTQRKPPPTKQVLVITSLLAVTLIAIIAIGEIYSR